VYGFTPFVGAAVAAVEDVHDREYNHKDSKTLRFLTFKSPSILCALVPSW